MESLHGFLQWSVRVSCIDASPTRERRVSGSILRIEEKDQDQENKGNVSVVSTMCDRTGLNGVHHVKEEKINAHLGQWQFPKVSQRK
jgi:hypothetical protein